MRRREFILVLGGAAAWPLVAQAQQPARPMRRIGVIMNYAKNDPEAELRLSALRRELQKLGWIAGNNVRIESRWAAGETDQMRSRAMELIGLPVDVIVANSTPLISILRQLTPAIPIVFVQVADPISSGFVNSYAKPGGNITGFTDFEPSIASKWIELLREAAPHVNKVTVLLDPEQLNHPVFWRVIESAAPSFKMQVSAAPVHSRVQIEDTLRGLAGERDRGLVTLPGPVANTLRASIIELAARYRLPAIYPQFYYVREGGLMFYGNDQAEQWPKAAQYVDRILRGENPSALPVQAPTKYDLVINIRTATGLGLDISPTLLARADEVIE
jgi:putative tryptophan/tyrosine transport system substrate-binding protein